MAVGGTRPAAAGAPGHDQSPAEESMAWLSSWNEIKAATEFWPEVFAGWNSAGIACCRNCGERRISSFVDWVMPPASAITVSTLNPTDAGVAEMVVVEPSACFRTVVRTVRPVKGSVVYRGRAAVAAVVRSGLFPARPELMSAESWRDDGQAEWGGTVRILSLWAAPAGQIRRPWRRRVVTGGLGAGALPPGA